MGDAYALAENFPSELRQKSLKSVRISARSFLVRQEVFPSIHVLLPIDTAFKKIGGLDGSARK